MSSIRLELLGEEHLGPLGALLNDPDVLRFTRVPEPPPAGFARQWLEMYEVARRDGSREAFAVFGEDERFAGVALAPEIDRTGKQLELGYIVAAEARGQGVGTAILRALTRWAFEDAGAERAFLLIDVDNAASLRVAERSGYVQEGVIRSMHVKQGRRADVTLWSRLPSDPEP